MPATSSVARRLAEATPERRWRKLRAVRSPVRIARADPAAVLGVEGAGIVQALGADVTTLAVGDRIAYAGAVGAYAAERLLPSWRSATDRELAEERRLFYVAATRAKDQLLITHAARRNRRETAGPSRFLTEAGLIQDNRQALAA